MKTPAKSIYLNYKAKWLYEVRLKSNRIIGTFEQDNDGYFYYCFPNFTVAGFLDHSLIRQIADLLEEINEPWDAIVRQGMKPRDERSWHEDIYPAVASYDILELPKL